MISLDAPIESVARPVPRQRLALTKLGIRTVRDLLFHFPARYEEGGQRTYIRNLQEGGKATVVGEVLRLKAEKIWKKKLRVAEGIVRDDTGLLGVVWFNQPYVATMLKPGTRVRLSGKVTRGKDGFVMANPNFEDFKTFVQKVGTNHQLLTNPLPFRFLCRGIMWLCALCKATKPRGEAPRQSTLKNAKVLLCGQGGS